MTDKEKFRKEVEKLKSNLIYGACSSQVAMETRCKEEAYNKVLAILDTMQEEPKFNVGNTIRYLEDGDIRTIVEVREDYYKLDDSSILHFNAQDRWELSEKSASTRDKLRALSDGKQHLGWLDDAREVEEEPVSEGLEDAAFDYAEACKYDGGKKLLCVEHFKAGAQWQKEQDQSTIELAEDHAMLAGMEKMKEEMMVKAIDGIARPDDNEIWCNLASSNLKDGDKVKVIVIKED